MKLKYFFILPIVMLLASLVSSIIAFNNTNKLNEGYLFIKNETITAPYDGDYFAIIGNLQDSEQSIYVSSETDGVHITTYDAQNAIINEYVLQVTKVNQSYDPSIVSEVTTTAPVAIDSNNDYLFYISLEAGTTYNVSYTSSTQTNTDNMMDVVLVNLPDQYYNTKDIMENVAFTSLLFAVISTVTIFAIMYIKKDRV